MKNISIKKFIETSNRKINLFTPGPASLTTANINGLMSCFGRGDQNYKNLEKRIIKKIKNLSGQKNITYFQGSGSLALELVSLNFLFGKVLIISSGYYSDRLFNLCKNAKKTHGYIKKIDKVHWSKIDTIKNKYDWIWSCYVETSRGLKLPLQKIKLLSKKTKAKLALDATASIGLEKNHKLADVISFSSCKGLFGLTGGAFLCFNYKPKNKVNSFYLNINAHLKKKMTGPYHILQSLDLILKNYIFYKKAVEINKLKMLKKYKDFLIYKKEYQPLICTFVKKKIKAKSKQCILYKSRLKINGSIVSHLGEVYLGSKARGKILDKII